MAICKQCGKQFQPKEAWHTTCWECHKASASTPRGTTVGNRIQGLDTVGARGPSPSSVPTPRPAPSPSRTPSPPAGGSPVPPNPSPTPRFSNKFVIAGSFYDESGFLKREVFIETAEAIADRFKEAKLTQTSLRRLFGPLKAEQNRLRLNSPTSPQAFGPAREALYRLIPLVESYTKREIHRRTDFSVFLQFLREHCDLACKEAREFIGFVELFTSVIARLKPKS